MMKAEEVFTLGRSEGMNGLFQAARARAGGYRNDANVITMIYLIGAPIWGITEGENQGIPGSHRTNALLKQD
jgi:hypothetical protein